jgi:hypothetical protein
VLHAVDEHAVQGADLGGGQPDAERVVHERAHPRDLVAQRLVEDLHRTRLGTQHGVAEHAHVGQRGAPPRGQLGVEALLLDRVLHHLHVVLVLIRHDVAEGYPPRRAWTDVRVHARSGPDYGVSPGSASGMDASGG